MHISNTFFTRFTCKLTAYSDEMYLLHHDVFTEPRHTRNWVTFFPLPSRCWLNCVSWCYTWTVADQSIVIVIDTSYRLLTDEPLASQWCLFQHPPTLCPRCIQLGHLLPKTRKKPPSIEDRGLTDLPLLLASAAPRRTPRRASQQLVTAVSQYSSLTFDLDLWPWPSNADEQVVIRKANSSSRVERQSANKRTDRQTDRQTDGQTLPTILLYLADYSAVKKYSNRTCVITFESVTRHLWMYNLAQTPRTVKHFEL